MENQSSLWDFGSLEEEGSLLLDRLEEYKKKRQKNETSFWRSHNPPGCPESLDFVQNWQNLLLNLYLLQENNK